MAISAALTNGIRRSGVGRTFTRPARGGGTYTVKTQLRLNASQLTRGMDDWEQDVLNRTGGFIRKVIQRSMRPGGKAHERRRTRSNRPPLYWRKTLRNLVLFTTNLNRSTVSWGVASIKTSSQSRKGIPRVIEEGGSARVEVLQRDSSDPTGWSFVKVRAKYRKFPYVAPQKRRAIKFMQQVIAEQQL